MAVAPYPIWEKIVELLRRDMSDVAIQTWFGEAKPVSCENNTFVLAAPSEFVRDTIVERFIPKLQAQLFDLFATDFDVVVITEDRIADYQAGTPFLKGGERYTFETYIVGPSNKLAHAAALAVSEHPATPGYNPLFIYGPSGVGKTHLLYAIAHAVHRRSPETKIAYIRGEEFLNEMVSAIKNQRNQEFRQKYRFVDLFLMDDIQSFAKGRGTQEEMFHTFNALYENNKQIVLTADVPPKDMYNLDERLKTRFEWGLSIDIQQPEYETRAAIIKTKAVERGLDLNDVAIEYIAENITGSVRRLEGTLNKMMAFGDLMGGDLKETSMKAIKDFIDENSEEFLITPVMIIEEVVNFFNIEEEALRGHGRAKSIVFARQVAMFLLRKLTKLSYVEIGREFSDRDHSTVIYSTTNIEKKKFEKETSEVLRDIENNINSRSEY
jgi:chromosomal replication initiator protein DnaA